MIGQLVNQRTTACISRRWGSRKLPQEQSEESSDNFHRGAVAGATGKFPAGFEPGWTGPGAHRADYGTD